MLDETPAEVTFLGQRESNFIDIEIYYNWNLTNLCEIEALGTCFIIFCTTIF